MERNKGITLVALVITIILLLILSTVTINYGLQTYENNRIHRFVAQMQMIQKKVDNFSEDIRKEEDRISRLETMLGREITYINDANQIEIIEESRGNDGMEELTDTSFIYFSIEDMEKAFALDNIKENDEFAINFNTREVISLLGEKYNGNNVYYTQYNQDLPNSQNLVQYENTKAELTFENDVKCSGLNSKIVVKNISVSNTTVSYRQKGENENEESNYAWIIAKNHTTKNEELGENEDDIACEISITKAGTYEVRVEDVDDRENVETINITLNNSPNLDEDLTPINSANEEIDILEINEGLWYNYESSSSSWAFAKDASNTVYVWIPRFIYNTSGGEIKFLKGNSNIPTDDEDVNLTGTSTWELPEQFGSYPRAATGIWVEIKGTDNRGALPRNIFTDAGFNIQSRDIIV